MTGQAWVHVSAGKTAELCEPLSLSDSASALLADNPAPPQFLERLLESGDFSTALGFMAAALPARQAVWWGCLCLEIAKGRDLSAREERALTAAVRWVIEPTEAHRQAASAPADAAGLATPAGNLAKAAFWSGGSMLPPGQPVLAPPPVLRPQAVNRAVTALAGDVAAAHRERAHRQFLAIATGIACDRHRWPKG